MTIRIRRSSSVLLALLLVLGLFVVAPAPKAAAAPSPAVTYIEQTFDLFLGRAPTAEELQHWTSTVELGHPHALTRVLAVSEQWAGREIAELYGVVLRRPPEPAGLRYWLGTIAGGATVEGIAVYFYGGDEYYVRNGGSAAGFVDGLYRDTLGRPGEKAGRDYWIRQVQLGTPRYVVAAGFVESIEKRRARVTSLYRRILGRDPDRAGLDYWAEVVRQLGDVALASYLASSPEFYRRATGVNPPPPVRGVGTGFAPYAEAAGVTLHHPTAVAEHIGFHQSSKRTARDQPALPTAIRWTVLPSRGRGTGLRTASDVAVPRDLEVRSPVTGRVDVAETYRLYCDSTDQRIVIIPDQAPNLRVTILHVEGLRVARGDRVRAGVTEIADRARVLPLHSQVDDHYPPPALPHVHIEVVEPVDAATRGC